MDAMKVWANMEKPPATALKTIGAGRLKGKSDINPQWRYRIMTENFGLCGVGWKYTIDRLWTESGHGGEIFAFSQVSVYIKVDGEWSEPIPGVGGHKLLESELKGIHNNDEAFKMSTTDALGTAMKMLGVASAIYEGRWDGAKYAREPAATSADPSGAAANKPSAGPKPAGKAGFGTGSKTAPPAAEPFKWSTATSQQRLAYTVAKIAKIAEEADPVKATEALSSISSKLKQDEFSPADWETVTEKLKAVEAIIAQEAAAANQ